MPDATRAIELIQNLHDALSDATSAIEALLEESDAARREADARGEEAARPREGARGGAPRPGLWACMQDRHSRVRRYVCTMEEAEAWPRERLAALLSLELARDAACDAVLREWQQGHCNAWDTVQAVFQALLEVTPDVSP